MEFSNYKELEPFWGSWYIKKAIGEGAFGKVFEVEREDFGKIYTAAMKIISIPQSESEWQSTMSEGMDEKSVTAYYKGFVEELIEEIMLMSKLRGHSNIVSYEDHAVIEHKNGHGWDILIRMELLKPLVSLLPSDRSMDRSEIVKLGIDLCTALEICFSNKLIHRDIKPENIFLSPLGSYKLGDFGIARKIEQTQGALSKKGTFSYMAPEVYKGESYGAGVDIYSLGMVLYRLSNRNRGAFMPPYPDIVKFKDKEESLRKRIQGQEMPLPVDAQDELGRVICKACAFKQNDRFKDPTEFKEALLSIQRGEKSSVTERPARQEARTVVTEPVTPIVNANPIYGYGEKTDGGIGVPVKSEPAVTTPVNIPVKSEPAVTTPVNIPDRSEPAVAAPVSTPPKSAPLPTAQSNLYAYGRSGNNTGNGLNDFGEMTVGALRKIPEPETGMLLPKTDKGVGTVQQPAGNSYGVTGYTGNSFSGAGSEEFGDRTVGFFSSIPASRANDSSSNVVQDNNISSDQQTDEVDNDFEKTVGMFSGRQLPPVQKKSGPVGASKASALDDAAKLKAQKNQKWKNDRATKDLIEHLRRKVVNMNEKKGLMAYFKKKNANDDELMKAWKEVVYNHLRQAVAESEYVAWELYLIHPTPETGGIIAEINPEVGKEIQKNIKW